MRLNVSQMFHQGSYSNCGLEIWGFGSETEPAEWNMQSFVQKCGGLRPQLRHIIAFSGNRWQAKSPLGPHTFADWLIKYGEPVHASRWQRHNGGTIKAYFWYPSAKFKRAFNKAWKARPKANSPVYSGDTYW